jgi:serine/threonine-protein kinase
MTKSTFLCPFCGLSHDSTVKACPKTDEPLGPVHKMGGTLLDGKYRVEAVIGTGGMGVVYEGRHKVIDRRVAVKFLIPETCSTPEVRQRFINEAKIAAALGHKNIVAVLDMGETTGGVPYIVMEYLEGESLGDHIQNEGVLNVDRAVGIAMQILDGLHAVHSEGIIHRDLKPENVFLAKQSGGEEIVKLLDFGISRLDREEGEVSRLTEAGKVYGTPYYVSPEQAEGKLSLDGRADLYSVGVLLYEMVTGYLPFRSKSYATLMVDIITRPPPDPRDFLPELPVDLVAVINKALAKNTSLRYPSAREMSDALAPLVSRISLPPARKGSQPPAKKPPPATPPSEPPRHDSMTGYRIVVPQYEVDGDEGPLARARKRRSSKPPVGEPAPVDAARLVVEGAAPEEELKKTKPIPRSDPSRATPRMLPEERERADEAPPRPAGGPSRVSEPPDDMPWKDEEVDEVDEGWDI